MHTVQAEPAPRGTHTVQAEPAPRGTHTVQMEPALRGTQRGREWSGRLLAIAGLVLLVTSVVMMAASA